MSAIGRLIAVAWVLCVVGMSGVSACEIGFALGYRVPEGRLAGVVLSMRGG